MTKKNQLLIEQSEIRQRLNALLGQEALDDGERTELETKTSRAQEVEVELRAAIIAEPDDAETRETALDTETRERLELRGKARLGRYVEAAMRGRAVDGAESELMSAAGVDGIPLELWEKPVEQRDITPAGATVGVNLDPIRPAVFAPSVIDMLNVDMPVVGSGSYSTATISAAVTASALAKGGAAPQTAGALTAATVVPKRISGSLGLSLEDIAAIGSANFESALRENLSLVLSAELDNQLLNGAGSSNDLNGIISRLTAASAPTTGLETWSDLLEKQASGVDGLWASQLDQIGILMGVDSYRLAASVFQSSDAEESALSYMTRQGESVMTNSRMPAKASHIQKGILVRKGRTGMTTAVSPSWGSIQIDDQYSGALKGERYLTVAVLVGDLTLVQPGAYAELQFRVSI